MIARRPDAAVYMQLAAELRDQITNGTYPPGSLIPSETALTQQYGVARETVRRAVRELDVEGLVAVEPGRGTRVRVSPDRVTVKLPRGSKSWSRPATPGERDRFQLGRGEWVTVVEYGGREQVYPAGSSVFTAS